MKKKYNKGDLIIAPKDKMFVFGPGPKYTSEILSWSFGVVIKSKKDELFVVNIKNSACKGWVKELETFKPEEWDFRKEIS